MSWFGLPQRFGVRPDGHCGHCGGKPEHSAYSAWGRFCMACFRWCVYYGPRLVWGDGMRNS